MPEFFFHCAQGKTSQYLFLKSNPTQCIDLRFNIKSTDLLFELNEAVTSFSKVLSRMVDVTKDRL